MKTTLSALMAATAIVAVMPAFASAQPYGPGRGYGSGPEYGPGRGYGPDQGYGRGYDGPGYGGQSFGEREANIAQRIDEGERRGGLTRDEVRRLRDQLRQIQRLEFSYQRGGFNNVERRDLNRRLDALSAQVDRERRDNDTRGDQIFERLSQIDRSIAEGARYGGLTRPEADRLRMVLDQLRRLVSDSRRSGDGLDGRERADLNRRLDQLANRVRDERRDDQTRGGRF